LSIREKIIVSIILIVLISVIALPVATFYYVLLLNEKNQHLFLSSPNNWSAFGDFLNGLSTPILTAINILVFVYISLKLSKLENQSIALQRKIVICQMRQEGLEKLQTNILRLNQTREKEHYSYKQYAEELKLILSQFKSNYDHIYNLSKSVELERLFSSINFFKTKALSKEEKSDKAKEIIFKKNIFLNSLKKEITDYLEK